MEDYENILNNIKRYVSLNKEDEKQFISIVRTTKVKRRQFIVQPNFICTHQTDVLEGAFRSYFVNDEGKGLGEAKKTIDEYSETAGAFRAKLKEVDGKQEGDPVKAAKAIINLVNSENPTLRLPLGKVALMTIGMKLDSVKSDLEANREIAESAVY